MSYVWLFAFAACSQSALSTPNDSGVGGDLSAGRTSDMSTRVEDDLSATSDLAGRDLISSSDTASPTSGDLAIRLPDLDGADCAAISAAVQAYIDSNASCAQPSDCAETTTKCGLAGQCGAFVTTWALPGLMTLAQEWTDHGCTGPCPPCAFPGDATCTAGMCASNL